MEDKAIKLRSPNFVVSTTRLSVRNIPFSMTESKLRALAIKAVKERASKERPEVKQVWPPAACRLLAGSGGWACTLQRAGHLPGSAAAHSAAHA